MLIINNKQLQLNASKDKDPEMFVYWREYKEGIEALQTRFPKGDIQLRRNGFPKWNKNPDGTRGLREDPPMILIKATAKPDKNGATWAYCKGRPLIQANGLVEVPPNDNSIELGQEYLHLSLSQPDYTFFLMFKSGILDSEYVIHDPEGEALKEAREKSERRKVSSAIDMMDDHKTRLMAQAWKVKGASTKDIDILKSDLEKAVFKKEEFKKKNPTQLMLRGMAEFLSDCKDDDHTRPRAIITMGIETGKITFNKNHYYFDGQDICLVPYGMAETETTQQEFLRQFLGRAENKDKWLSILQGLLTKEYIDGSDKYGIKYLCGQFGIPLNQKEVDLRNDLLERLGLEVPAE